MKYILKYKGNYVKLLKRVSYEDISIRLTQDINESEVFTEKLDYFKNSAWSMWFTEQSKGYVDTSELKFIKVRLEEVE